MKTIQDIHNYKTPKDRDLDSKAHITGYLVELKKAVIEDIASGELDNLCAKEYIIKLLNIREEELKPNEQKQQNTTN